MKVYIYKTYGNYNEQGEITKVFDSKDKTERWHKRMVELSNLHNQYHRDGTVTRSGGSTSSCPEILALQKEAGCEDYLGDIIEMDVE